MSGVIEGYISGRSRSRATSGRPAVLVYNLLNKADGDNPAGQTSRTSKRGLLLVQGVPGISARAGAADPGAGRKSAAVELIAQGRPAKPFGAVANYEQFAARNFRRKPVSCSSPAMRSPSFHQPRRGRDRADACFDTPPIQGAESSGRILDRGLFVGSGPGFKVAAAIYGYGVSEPGGFLTTTGFKSHIYSRRAYPPAIRSSGRGRSRSRPASLSTRRARTINEFPRAAPGARSAKHHRPACPCAPGGALRLPGRHVSALGPGRPPTRCR